MPIPPLLFSDAARWAVVPSITAWNRLEGRPREQDFSRSLRAEVRDPLWFLCRQWQMGEFEGEDAGTAVEARFVTDSSRFEQYVGGSGTPVPYTDAVPLEVQVEQETIHFDLFTQLQVGKTWVRLLQAEGLESTIATIYVPRCPFVAPTDQLEKDYRASQPDTEAWLSLTEGRIPNGETLLTAIRDGSHASWLGVLSGPDRSALTVLGKQLAKLFDRVYSQPDPVAGDAWLPEHLEYQFGVTLNEPDARVSLDARQYYEGHLDWYSFDRGNTQFNGLAPATERTVLSYIPTPIQYYGMPNRRWWTFEDGVTNLGNLNTQTSDLATLLFAEFALLFSNDWHLLPCELPVGTFTNLEGILVTDVFGVQTWVRPAGRGLDDDWQRWSMFNLTTLAPDDTADTRLLLPPSTIKTQDGEPLEELRFIRDEMANLVWGIEKTVSTDMAQGEDGYESSTRLLAYLQRIGAIPADVIKPAPPDDQPPAPLLTYELGTTVPRNWIPFIPVNISSGSPQIRLQKAAMPEFVATRYGDTVPSRTSLLVPRISDKPLFINEEEVPRAGTVVTRQFNRTRWYHGKTFTWIAKRKEAGRGEGSSGLQFDQVGS
ncbi:hypothetical protein J2I47_02035 [Fibrella sp. HMF5335]|uniref:Uncharacterized protein n=1 Tax=Fibrella rubiginis TaxID=2817060 RepID=A0A939K1J6_9BACT|nr:hypothetical protein [Fibrella rubiginis]MBO0935319.1 hypothetical protein [Fibrella rubiginis]